MILTPLEREKVIQEIEKLDYGKIELTIGPDGKKIVCKTEHFSTIPLEPRPKDTSVDQNGKSQHKYITMDDILSAKPLPL
jgi:hypothetical protein